MPERLKGQDLRSHSLVRGKLSQDFKKSCGLVPTEVRILLSAFLFEEDSSNHFKLVRVKVATEQSSVSTPPRILPFWHFDAPIFMLKNLK